MQTPVRLRLLRQVYVSFLRPFNLSLVSSCREVLVLQHSSSPCLTYDFVMRRARLDFCRRSQATYVGVTSVQKSSKALKLLIISNHTKGRNKKEVLLLRTISNYTNCCVVRTVMLSS